MTNLSSHYKGWARPGPIPTADEPEVPADQTFDALSGYYKIFQLKAGHRFSTDDLLTAWYGTLCAPSARRVLDLGSGIGSVGMMAAWRLQGAQFVTIEAQEESVRLARQSARYNGIETRYDIREGDFRTEGLLKRDEKFDLILGSPPYFPLGTGVLGDHPQKISCRFEVRGDIQDYCQTAVRHLERAGTFSCVFPVNPPAQRARIFEAAQATQLSILRWRPVILREGEPPLLGVFTLTHSDDLPESFRNRPYEEPPLTIRLKDGSIHPEYSVVKLSIGFPP